MNQKTEKIKNSILIAFILICFVLLIIIISSMINVELKSSISDTKLEEKDFVYLSDIPYIKEQSSVGWGNLTMDSNLETQYNGGMISLIVDGEQKNFFKGISAHATSTVIFDITNYDYDYFSTYYGVDASRGTRSDGVKFAIYTSVDGENWDLHTLASPPIKKGNTEAEFINVDIKGKNYIKLYCLQYGNATSDHCAYGNSILYKEGYNPSENQKIDFIKTVDEYDNILKNLTKEEQLNNYELTLLQRELVSRVGYELLVGLANLNDDYKNTLRWLMTDTYNLREYLLGGKPEGGSYINSLKVLTRLYTNYKDDFKVNTTSKYGNNVGQLYTKMALALSLTHSQKVALWMQPSEPSNQSDPVTRYRIFKKLYNEGKFVVNDSLDITKWYETYTVEEMRYVMNNLIDDESIEWLNAYVQSQIDAHPNQYWSYLSPHPYMAYVYPNYGNAVFHDPNRKEYWDNLYGGIFSKYGVTYTQGASKVYKVWMNFRNEFGTGAVCGGISKTGSNIRTTHGIPCVVIGQPGHAAMLYYTQNDAGDGYWNIDNNISGWPGSEKGERLPLSWGEKRYVSTGYNVSYIVMAQEALNRYDLLKSSMELLYLANMYNDNLDKKEEYIRASIKELSFNFDSWYQLIELYNSSSKTEEEYFNLSKELSVNMFMYPLPYYDLMAMINRHLTDNEYKFSYNLLLNNTLIKGSTYDSTDIVQPAITRVMASHLLGRTDTSLATFSFSGEDAGKIVLSSRFDNSGIRWDYSLDGKNTWNEVSFTGDVEHKYVLTKDEIESITAENDIYVHIVGADYNEENVLKIDITDNTISENNYFRNDLENRILGINLNHEWRNSESDSWTSYALKSPDNTGNKTLQIREAANGTKLASNVLTFNFTEDNQPDSRKYVPVSHLSIHAVSTEAASHQGSATFAIDGNYNTRYHSAWNGTDTERYVTVKLDKPMVISAVEFVPGGGGNGKIYDGTIYGSMDGVNWETLSSLTNLRYTNNCDSIEDAIKNTKSFEIENPKLVQYVKIVNNRSNANWFAAREFNFYEDYTKNPNPTASVGFDIKEPTNGNVTARLSNPSTEIRITNNGGSDTYVFTENGSFTFEFEDVNNHMTGSATATVTWIDKTAPTATIRYNINKKTNKEVVATLIPSEEVVVLNNGSYESDNQNANPLTHMFMENGEFTFEFVDAAGNKGSATASVDWIDTQEPIPFVTYSTMNLTNQDVIVAIEFDKPDAVVTNNDGKNEYVFTENGNFTFEYTDEAGNIGAKTVYVNWIDKVAPNVNVAYSTTKSTTEPVTATITSDEEIIITNNNGSNTYTFTQNGTFEFTYEDALGNKGKATAVVTWITDKSNNNHDNNHNDNNENDNPNNNNPGNNTPDNKNPNNPNNNKPNDENNNSNNNNNNPGENTQNPGTIDYKEYSINNITLSVPSVLIKEELSLSHSRYIVSNRLTNKYGKNSEYFELSLKNQNDEKINLFSKLKLTINLDTSKEFLGIYEVNNKTEAKALEYKKLEQNTILVETENLGKYIIHYKEDQIKPNVTEEKKSNKIIWFIGFIILILGALGFINTKRKSKTKESESTELESILNENPQNKENYTINIESIESTEKSKKENENKEHH